MLTRPVRLLRTLSTLIALIAARPVAAQTRDTMAVVVPARGALTFLAFGDWGRNGESPQREVAVQLGETARAFDAKFFLVLGDNFYPNGVQSVNDPQWRTSLENVYTAYPLGVDWYVALGNHDYHGNPQAEVDYSKVSRRWRMPSRYYSITKTVAPNVTAQFLIIDTSPFIEAYRKEPESYHVAGADTARQRRWIESTLKASTAQWKFIVGHHNVFSGGKRTVMPDMERLLVPIMKKYGVNAYICGHEHHLEHIQPEANGPHYFISGAAAEANEAPGTKGTRFSTAGPGFLAMSLFADSMLVQAIGQRGNVLYRASIKR
ncbi:MAG: tartrate-resistant acid phosphatase type 5 family protein [bacterium]